jgi:NAD(P)-dependent dehydrogenase (short-subunit alcohol dehydrogenase family)
MCSCMAVSRAGALIEEIQATGGTATFYPADLSSVAEVRALAQAVARDHRHLDVLINNAGIGRGERELSADGYELRFAVNYLSGFLLTRLLLPYLGKEAPSRVVNVSSAGQQAIDFTDVMLTKGYSGIRAYCQSKLAQIMFTFDLAGEFAGQAITANCLHPATYMDTAMVRGAGLQPRATVQEGGEAIFNLAASPAMAGKSGVYFDGTQPSRANDQAYDAAARRQLRALSFNLTGLSESSTA